MSPRAWLAIACLVLPLAFAGPSQAQASPATGCASSDLISQTPPAFAQLGITTAWRLSKGRGVKVAVVDSGVDATNPHLSGVVDPGTTVFGSGDGRTDSFGTGTAIASQIAGKQVKGSGLVGVAPGTRIVPVRVFESTEVGKVNPSPDLTARGIRWASAQPGVRIIVVAQAAQTDSAALRSAVVDATKHGALVVAGVGEANGENDQAITFPAGYQPALAVTAVDATGTVTAASVRGTHVELAAPGSQVLAAYKDGDCLLAATGSSTGYAAGYAAGVAALVAAAHPSEKPADWQYRLLVTGLRPSPDGRSKQDGWGMIAPYAAINFVNDGTRSGPPNPRFPAPKDGADKDLPATVPTPPNPSLTAFVIAIFAALSSAVVAAGLLARRLRPGAKKPQNWT